MAGDSGNRHTEMTPRKCFRYGYKDHIIGKFLKPPKYNEKHRKQVCFSEIVYCASQKECNNGKNKNDQKIYAFMARMSDYYKYPSRNFGGSSQFINCILDSLATCHMTPEV